MRRRQHRAPVGEAQSRPVDGEVVAEAQAGVDEVLPVLVRLEADHVRAQHPVDELVAPREAGEELRGRKRDVQEEADRLQRAVAPEQGRQAGQLVVVDPEERVGRRNLERALGEALVGGVVVAPPAAVDDDVVDEPVAERPQRAVREAVVVVLDLGLAQGDRDELGGQVGQRVRHVGRAAVPPDPEAGPGVERGTERADEPAVSRAPAIPRLHDREPVRDRDDRGRALLDRRLQARPFSLHDSLSLRSAAR